MRRPTQSFDRARSATTFLIRNEGSLPPASRHYHKDNFSIRPLSEFQVLEKHLLDDIVALFGLASDIYCAQSDGQEDCVCSLFLPRLGCFLPLTRKKLCRSLSRFSFRHRDVSVVILLYLKSRRRRLSPQEIVFYFKVS
jgi:hypothetical protein